MVTEKIRKEPIKRNYEGFTVPAEVAGFIHEPLYILVAEWCRLQSRWVSRMDVAEAFDITPGRATFQLSWLSRRTDIIQCEIRRVRRSGSPVASHEVWVERVDLTRLHARLAMTQSLKSQPSGSRRSRVGNADRAVREQLKLLWPVRATEDK